LREEREKGEEEKGEEEKGEGRKGGIRFCLIHLFIFLIY